MTKSMLAALAAALALALPGLGYITGHSHGLSQGRAEINALKARQAEEKQQDAEAYGKALAEALDKYRAEVTRGQMIARQFEEEKQRHEKQAKERTRRIAAAVRGNTHTFSPDFVLVYNAAIGIEADALPGSLCAAAPHAGAGSPGAPVPGNLERIRGVSEADLLAHINQYGRRCRDLEAQVRGWQALARQRAGHSSGKAGEQQ